MGAGKLYHPGHPPNNDFPASWTEDKYNSYYWGNGAPIGDAGGCGKGTKVVVTPGLAEYGSSAACTSIDDAAAMNDHDNKSTPQGQQDVMYDHRVTTRTIENMRRAVSMGKPFFVAAGVKLNLLGGGWQPALAAPSFRKVDECAS